MAENDRSSNTPGAADEALRTDADQEEVKGPVLVTVTLLKDHTHGGREYKAGDEIMVTEEEREFLADPVRKVVDGPQRVQSNVRDTAVGAQVQRTGDAPGLQGRPGETRHTNPKAPSR